MFSELITFLYNDGFTCLAYSLTCLSVGFIAGWWSMSYKMQCQNRAKTLPNTSSTAKCELTGNYQFIEFTEPKLFFKPKITKCSCSFYNKGICAKTSKPCFLITQYSQNYFKQL